MPPGGDDDAFSFAPFPGFFGVVAAPAAPAAAAVDPATADGLLAAEAPAAVSLAFFLAGLLSPPALAPPVPLPLLLVAAPSLRFFFFFLGCCGPLAASCGFGRVVWIVGGRKGKT